MKFISPLLKRIVYPPLAKAGYFRHLATANDPAVVTYHGVLPAGYRSIDPDLDGSMVTIESLRGQLQLLKNRYHIISPAEFLAWAERGESLPPRSVLLTCDDGLQNAVTDMLPVLQENGVSCLFFVVGTSLEAECTLLWYEQMYLLFIHGPDALKLKLFAGQRELSANGWQEKRNLWWELVKQLSAYDAKARADFLAALRAQLDEQGRVVRYLAHDASRRRFTLLNRKGLETLVNAGMVIGAHTCSHGMLSKADPTLAWSEIQSPRSALSVALGQPIWAFAYPFGGADSITSRDILMAEQAGFTCAFLNSGGGFGAKMPRFAIPRVHVTSDMTISEFEAHLSGFYRQARRRFLHDRRSARMPDHAVRV